MQTGWCHGTFNTNLQWVLALPAIPRPVLLSVPLSATMISNILHPPQTPAHSFLLRSQQTALPPHTSWHASGPALDFFLRDTTEDLILPLNKAGPAISALESISSWFFNSLTKVSYPISHMYNCLSELGPSQWFLRMLRSLPLIYSLILHLPPTFSIA